MFDTTTKSTWSNARLYCEDLKGCGDETHTYASHDFTINARIDCEAPTPGLQLSWSGYIARSLPAGNNVAQVAATVLGTPIGTGIDTLLGWLTEDRTIAGLDTAFGLATPSFKLKGSNYTYEQGTRSKRTVAQVQVPQVYIVEDQCNEPAGIKLVTAASIIGFDTATCEAGLLWQASLSLYVGYNLYEETPNWTTVTEDVGSTGTFLIAEAATSTIDCAAIPADPGGARAALVGTPLVFGSVPAGG